MTMNLEPSQLLDDPENFLHSIDIDGDRATFFRTNAQLLREASFVDGRIDIATASAAQPPCPVIMSRRRSAIVVSCSLLVLRSTLLARLLDVPGRSLVLKEPAA